MGSSLGSSSGRSSRKKIPRRIERASAVRLFHASLITVFVTVSLIICLPAFWVLGRRLDNLTLFYHYLLFLPLIINAGLAIFVRLLRPVTLFCALVICLVFCLPFIRDYGKNTLLSDQASPVALKVATYNARVDNTDMLSFNMWLRAYLPDIVVIEEISEAQKVNAQTLSELYPYTTLGTQPRDVLIISRLPILAQKRIVAPDGRREIIYAEVQTAQGPLKVYGLHAETLHTDDQWNRRNEYLTLAASVISADRGSSTLVMGDFNASPWNRFFTGLTREADLHSEPGLFPPITRLVTEKAGEPMGARIDHILTSPGNRLSKCRTSASMGSDHKPLICDLYLKTQ